MAAGSVMKKLTRNLSFILQPCVLVAAMVVSEMNERLSPKNAPPTTTAVSSATSSSMVCASPEAMGTRATIVPTLVPIDRLMKHVAMNSPGSTILLGSSESMVFTVASTAPIAFAELAKAPASTNIHNIVIMFGELAPRLNTETFFCRFLPPAIATAYMPEIMNATLIGTL